MKLTARYSDDYSEIRHLPAAALCSICRSPYTLKTVDGKFLCSSEATCRVNQRNRVNQERYLVDHPRASRRVEYELEDALRRSGDTSVVR